MAGDSDETENARLAQIADTLAAALGCPRAEAIDRIASVCQRLPLNADGLAAVLRNGQRARRRRNEAMQVDLFRDPAWDMLIELLLARREGRPIPVSVLCFASGVPATTALRHVEWMEEGGLITRRGDFEDHRRVLVDLAPGVGERLEKLVREIYVDSLLAVAQFDGGGNSPDDGSLRPAG